MKPTTEEQERAARWVAENVDKLPQNVGELVAMLTLYHPLDRDEIRNLTIEECVAEIEEMVKPQCSDHTPYYGPCGSCGSAMNYDVLPDPDEVIAKLLKLKSPSTTPNEAEPTKEERKELDKGWEDLRDSGLDKPYSNIEVKPDEAEERYERYDNALEYLQAGKMGWRSRLQKAFLIASGYTPPPKKQEG